MSETAHKLKLLLEYWIDHNREHIRDNEKWLETVRAEGMEEIAHRFEHVIGLSRQVNDELRHALDELGPHGGEHSHDGEELHGHRHIQLHQIGVIRSPYTESAPFQPEEDAAGDFRIVLDAKYTQALAGLETFTHVIVLFFLDRRTGEYPLTVTPPHAGGRRVGLFASRSPSRPNPIGLSVVKIKEIRDHQIHTSGIDAYDGTPVLDIKPYIESLDSKAGAGNGWTGGKM
jgi:tRNA-Thr(GGU) m(6)t(6)A37 methyltransferase TsaA